MVVTSFVRDVDLALVSDARATAMTSCDGGNRDRE
jgi:hypothetical protein